MKTADIVALPLQLGPALRHRRVFHPLGVLAAGRIERIAPADVGLPVESADILGRVSKTIGMPGGLPDLIGLARDVLIVSAGSGLLTRCALRPTVSWTGTTLSTLMPFRREDGWWWVEAAMITPMGSGLSLDAVREQILNSGIVFDVQQAHVTGFFEPLAELTLTTVIPTDEDHDVSLDPTRNKTPGVGLGPQWLTTLRERAYLRSRRGRNAPHASNP